MARIKGKILILKGKSGTPYTFELYTLDSNFEKDSAVYIFTRRYQHDEENVKHDKIYIGQTKDISQRFDNHHKADCIDKHKANCIGIHWCDESDLEEIERDLLLNHKTKCNELLN